MTIDTHDLCYKIANNLIDDLRQAIANTAKVSEDNISPALMGSLVEALQACYHNMDGYCLANFLGTEFDWEMSEETVKILADAKKFKAAILEKYVE